MLLELVWTLGRSYRVPADQVFRIVATLTRSSDIVLQDPVAARRGLWDAGAAQGDLADAIIAHTAIDAGCDGVVTFDHRAQRLPGMLPVD